MVLISGTDLRCTATAPARISGRSAKNADKCGGDEEDAVVVGKRVCGLKDMGQGARGNPHTDMVRVGGWMLRRRNGISRLIGRSNENLKLENMSHMYHTYLNVIYIYFM